MYSHKADIGDDDDAIYLLLDGPDGPLDDSIVGVGLRSDFVLLLGNAEEDHPRDPEGFRLLDLFDEQVDRELKMAGHG